MRLQIIAVGHKMPAWVDNAFDDYSRRLSGHNAVSLSLVATANRKPGTSIEQCRQQEADKISKHIKPGSHTIALDEHGRQWSTQEWAEQYRGWRLQYPAVNFIIGGPDGLDPGLLQKANAKVALGRLTLPHGLARVVLIEQLYRAWSVCEGHPYHRE
jgi:23S rRNA (pseudouridine1915-N3)-methyltransferase